VSGVAKATLPYLPPSHDRSQPQARMGWLHRLPHYLYEVLAQGKASRSASSRKRELKASRVFLASYFLR
jgi:hypothetical protein